VRAGGVAQTDGVAIPNLIQNGWIYTDPITFTVASRLLIMFKVTALWTNTSASNWQTVRVSVTASGVSTLYQYGNSFLLPPGAAAIEKTVAGHYVTPSVPANVAVQYMLRVSTQNNTINVTGQTSGTYGGIDIFAFQDGSI
jgi:hypothetical protein